MSAQPADASPPRVHVDKTITGVRGALPADKRAEFQAEIESTSLPEIAQVLERWWVWAVVWASPTATHQLDRFATGQVRAVPVEQVVGQTRWADAQARGRAA